MLMGKRRREKKEKRESGSETFEGSQEWGRCERALTNYVLERLGKAWHGTRGGPAPRHPSFPVSG
jgi:hypothetical protein